MDISNMQGWFMFLPMCWALLTGLVALYLAIRFLKALERGVRAHERLADGLTRVSPAQRTEGPDGRER